MNEFFYDFRFDETNHGYYYLKINNDSLYSLTRFIQPDGELYTNTFRLKLEDGRVMAYRYRNRPWVDFSQFPENSYPSSAYPLWLHQTRPFPFSYPQVDESKDQVVGVVVVEKTGSEIVEILDGASQRKFVLVNNQVHQIDWERRRPRR